jgi:hypothetical protein
MMMNFKKLLSIVTFKTSKLAENKITYMFSQRDDGPVLPSVEDTKWLMDIIARDAARRKGEREA